MAEEEEVIEIDMAELKKMKAKSMNQVHSSLSSQLDRSIRVYVCVCVCFLADGTFLLKMKL